MHKIVINVIKHFLLLSTTLLLLCSSKAFAVNELASLEVCIDPDWMPFEGVVNGQHTGIAKDYLRHFEALTPFVFKVKLTGSWNDSIELLKSGDCDLTLLINRSVEREKYLSFTLPYFFGPNVLVSKKEIPFMQDLASIGDKTLGIVQGYRLLDVIPIYHPDVNIKTFASEIDGLKALAEGEVDVYVGSLFSVNLRMKQLSLDHLKINGWISLQDELRIGLAKKNSHLVPIFNRAIEHISTKQHNDIFNRWSNAQIIQQDDYTLLYCLSGITFFIIIVFTWRYQVSSRVSAALHSKNKELERIRKELLTTNKDLEYLSFHDNLTGLYNRHYFMSTIKRHFSNVNRNKNAEAVLMIDLDYFKSINDKYGHAIGDKVLKQFATILTNTMRSGDVTARWGGEEFIVLLPITEFQQTILLAKRLISEVNQFVFVNEIKLTISIGIAMYDKSYTLDSWIEYADKALYQAKAAGRNCVKLHE